MSFRVYCGYKECNQEVEPLLDRKNDIVVCDVCGKEIKNITVFAKNNLVQLGQIKRDNDYQKAFSVECKHCSAKNQPILKGDKIYCPSCGEEHTHLTAPFAKAIKEFLGTQRKNSRDEPKKRKIVTGR